LVALGVLEQSLSMALERATSDARPNDYFLEESKERELAYTKQAFPRWKDTLALAQQHLGDTRQKSVLDVGVSQFTLALPDFFQSVYGLDLTDAFGQRCARRGVKLIHGGVHQDAVVESIPRVDCIFFLEAIEHLHSNPIEVLARLRGRLLENGILLVSTCNMMCLGNRVRMLFNRKLRHFDYPPFQTPPFAAHGFGHDRIYSPQELREYLLAAGCSRVECVYPMAGDERLARRSSPALLLSYALKRIVPSLRDTMLFIGRR
jgi:SAM-dependent methyltransferase